MLQKSPRLRELFLYVCQKTLQNQTDEVKEQRIGENVFGRRNDYNPSDDSIVRVEARHLRKRLEEYFQTEGRDEAVVIVIPKGTYVPRFVPREATPAATPPAESGALMPVMTADLGATGRGLGMAAPSTPESSIPTLRVWIAMTMVMAVALAWCGWLLLKRPAADPGPPRSALWSSLFSDTAQTLIICADSSWVLRQDLLGRPLTLSDYLSTNWNRPASLDNGDANPALKILSTKQYTSMADVRVVERLLLLNERYWKHTVIRSARNAQMRDFKNANIILLGSMRSTPWDELFEPKVNFWTDFDYKEYVPIVRNKNPRPGELPVYRNGEGGNAPGHAYSTIAYLPNLSHTGNILMIAGTSMEGTEAAGEYLTNPEFYAALLEELRVSPSKALPYFEVLLNSETLGGTSQASRVVAHRVLNGKQP